MQQDLIAEQLVVRAFTRPSFPRIGGVACKTNGKLHVILGDI